MKIAIVIPAYNEEKRIGKTLDDYLGLFSAKKKSKEIENFGILVVINKPQDNTSGVIEQYMKHHKELGYITLKQKGKGLAVRKGFEHSLEKDFDFIGFTDADDSVNAENFYKVLRGIGTADGAIASRYLPKSIMSPKHTPIRVLTAAGFNFMVRSLFFINTKDTQCGGKIFRKELLSKIIDNLSITQWAFDVDLLYQAKKQNGTIKEIPIFWQDASGSKIDPIKSSIQMFFAIIQLRMINSSFKKLFPIINPAINAFYKLIK
jgi:glycosyltransferase involved in cell wall biosynthesis